MTTLDDLRFAIRTAHKSPGFVIAAIGTLALGIGATASIFSILSGVMLRPLPYSDPERLVQIKEFDARNAPGAVFYEDLDRFRTQSAAFEEIAGFGNTSRNLVEAGEPERIQAVWGERNLFRMLGAVPLLGRTIQEDDALNVVVISASLWKRRFGGDPSCVGRKIALDGEPFTVIGVMPEQFQFPYRSSRGEAWIPFARHGRMDQVAGRLKTGVTLDAARQELTARCTPGRGVVITPISEVVTAPIRSALLTLLGAVALVLFIGCANVANLLLARAAKRSHEIAVRTALGATRWRLVRQLLTESLLLSGAGGAVGLLVAVGGMRLILKYAAAQIPRSGEIGLDWRVFCFLLGASAVTGIAFGILPALAASRVGPEAVLKEAGSRGAVGAGLTGWSGRRLRDGLVVAEVALSFTLLVGAGLLLRAFLQLQETPTGLVPDNVLTLRLTAATRDYPAPGAYGRYLQNLEDRVRELPGVHSAGFIQYLPLQNFGWSAFFNIAGQAPPAPGQTPPQCELRYVTTGYFEALRIPLRSGRIFNGRDVHGGPMVIVVNEALARRYFPGEDAVGRATDRGTIVGVVADVRSSRLDKPASPEIYYAATQNIAATSDVGVSLVVQTTGKPEPITKAVTAAIQQANPQQVVFDVKTMDQVIANSLADVHLYLWLLGLFAALALLLAVSGVYAVISCVVAARTQEFGIRVALGAEGGQILRLVLRHCLGLVSSGIVLGAAGTAVSARLLSSLVTGLRSADSATLALVACLLAAVALTAALAPALRAMRVDPAVALRS